MGDYRLSAIVLDEASVVHRTRAIEQEREVAIYDLLEQNNFHPAGSDGGPYHLRLGLEESRLVLEVTLEFENQTAIIEMIAETAYRVAVRG